MGKYEVVAIYILKHKLIVRGVLDQKTWHSAFKWDTFPLIEEFRFHFRLPSFKTTLLGYLKWQQAF